MDKPSPATSRHHSLHRRCEEFAPRGTRTPIVLTESGLRPMLVAERFTEQIIDLHWQALIDCCCGASEDLFAFVDFDLDGSILLADPSQVLGRLVAGAGA